MTLENHLNQRLFKLMFTWLLRYAYIFIYTIHTYTCLHKQILFINTVLQAGVCQNLSTTASLFKQIVIKFQSCTVANFPIPSKCKTMLPLYTCCKQTVSKAPTPQSKPPSLQQHSALRILYTFWGTQKKGGGGRKCNCSIFSIIKKETAQFKL